MRRLSSTIKGIVFDLDGTLVNSALGLASAVDKTLQHFQLPAAGVERVAEWIGNGADIMLQRAITWASGQPATTSQIQQARPLFDQHYQQTALNGSVLYPGVISVLQQLKKQQYQLAVVTNKPSLFVKPLLHYLQIETYFSVIIGADDVIIKKPHPAALFLILGQLGLLPTELVMVGDSRNDIEAARAAGIAAIGLSYGYNYGQPIADSHPDRVLDNFEQLMPALSNNFQEE